MEKYCLLIHQWNLLCTPSLESARERAEHGQQLQQFPQTTFGEKGRMTGGGGCIGQWPFAGFSTCGRQHDIVHFPISFITRITEHTC